MITTKRYPPVVREERPARSGYGRSPARFARPGSVTIELVIETKSPQDGDEGAVPVTTKRPDRRGWLRRRRPPVLESDRRERASLERGFVPV
jgi:hypothetical protein